MKFNEIKKHVIWKTLLPEPSLEVLYQTCIDVKYLEGNAAEIGVFRGGSLYLIAKALDNKTVYGFDSFSGIPVFVDEDKGSKHINGDFSEEFENVKQYLNGIENIKLIQGIFPSTLKEIDPNDKFCFVHIDADVFAPTFIALKWFWSRLVPNGIILVHDYDWKHTPGIKKAVDAFLKKFDEDDDVINHNEIKFDSFPSYYKIVRTHD